MYYPASKKELSEEELFIKRWGNIENWQTFQLFIDDQHYLTQVSNGTTNLFRLQWNVLRDVARFLNRIIPSYVNSYNYLNFASCI